MVHGRSRDRGEAVVEELREQTGNPRLHLHLADLSSLDEVRRLADEVEAGHDELHTLVNNAGIGTGPREESEDGYELGFAVNYLSHFLLTHRLLDLLRRSAPARIVNVASAGQQPLDFDDVMLEREYDGFRAYAQSKLAQVMFSFDLAERLPADEVTVNVLHPASLMDTKMVRETFGAAHSTVAEGAEATAHLVELEDVSGRFFDGMRPARADQMAYDRGARRRLWDISTELTS